MKVTVTHNPAQHRFEVDLPQGKALLDYSLVPGRINLQHTEVPPDHREQGIGEQLVRTALEYARQSGLKVVASCPFAAKFVAEHQEYQEIMKG